jgi:uncharacterized protein (DUF1015 family)
MAALRPFSALRPSPESAPRVAAVPYDVVTTEEAREQADGNGVSFLHVSRAEIEFPPGTDPYSQTVYERAAENFERLKQSTLVVDREPSLYLYRLRRDTHEQIGIAGCFSLAEYDNGIIKKHERTRRDKEDDRTRHMIALRAQTGPVFLVYRAHAALDAIAGEAAAQPPLFDFEAADSVRHTVWRVTSPTRDRLVSSFAGVPALYIADGHHRAASAARARDELRAKDTADAADVSSANYSSFLGVAFPHDQVQILPYNRVVTDLGSLSPTDFLNAVAAGFDIAPGPAVPDQRGKIAMYFNGAWQVLTPRERVDRSDPIGSLDVAILQHRLLEPVLNVRDIRTDKRVDFVGGLRGAGELQRMVDAGRAAVAFSLHPVSISDLMAVSDAGDIMPPKSTWFEPKLRDGLLIHVI